METGPDSATAHDKKSLFPASSYTARHLADQYTLIVYRVVL